MITNEEWLVRIKRTKDSERLAAWIQQGGHCEDFLLQMCKLYVGLKGGE